MLKFHNRDFMDKLKEEEKKWHNIYKLRVGIWSGSPALMMPHFSVIAIDERESFKEKIRYVLTFYFGNTWVHGDVRWRNIGKYRCHKMNEIQALQSNGLAFPLGHRSSTPRSIRDPMGAWGCTELRRLCHKAASGDYCVHYMCKI